MASATEQYNFEETQTIKIHGQLDFEIRIVYAFQVDQTDFLSSKGVPLDKLVGKNLGRFDGNVTVYRDFDIRFLQASFYVILFEPYEKELNFNWDYEGVSSFTDESKEFVRKGMKFVYQHLRKKLQV